MKIYQTIKVMRRVFAGIFARSLFVVALKRAPYTGVQSRTECLSNVGSKNNCLKFIKYIKSVNNFELNIT